MRTALYIVGGIIGIIGIAAIVMSIVYKQEIARYGYQTSLFTGAEQQHHFVRQERYFPVNEMPRSDEPFVFPEGPKLALPGTFAHDADSFEMEGFLESTDTAALLILKDGEILFEDYWLTGKMDRPSRIARPTAAEMKLFDTECVSHGRSDQWKTRSRSTSQHSRVAGMTALRSGTSCKCPRGSNGTRPIAIQIPI